MKKYVVKVTMKLNRYVIVEAGDGYEAERIAEDLCDKGEINLRYADFHERDVSAVREASVYDELTIKEAYRSE